jgi:replicative DNA helicase
VEQRESKQPTLADLRDSGAIEQDADCVIFAHRREYYLQRAPVPADEAQRLAHEAALAQARGLLDLHIAKQRQGDTTLLQVRFDPATNRVQ